jgi:hypothetical protein
MRCNPLQFPGNTDMMHVDTRSWGCFPWRKSIVHSLSLPPQYRQCSHNPAVLTLTHPVHPPHRTDGHPPTPWVPSSRSTSCPDMQYCPELMNKTVGRDPAMHHAFDPSRPNLATYFGGLWYSVPSQGKCPEGTAPGQSCSWRLQPGKTGKVVNASCMAKRIMVPIELNGKPCYDECPQPLDRTSDCYFGCLDKGTLAYAPRWRSPQQLTAQPERRDERYFVVVARTCSHRPWRPSSCFWFDCARRYNPISEQVYGD